MRVIFSVVGTNVLFVGSSSCRGKCPGVLGVAVVGTGIDSGLYSLFIVPLHTAVSKTSLTLSLLRC